MTDGQPRDPSAPSFERLTERARQVVVLAQEEARTLNHNYIGTEHLLLGLMREEDGLAARLLESLDISIRPVRAQVMRIVGSADEPVSGQIPFTPRARRVLELALREALSLGHNYIGTEHILLGMVRENDGVGLRILIHFYADPEKVRNEVIRMLAGPESRQGTAVTGRASPAVGGSGPEPAIDPGWLDGLPELLNPLGEEIRAELGRPPDVGDLLLAVLCVPHTPAAEALKELGVDADELWGRIERARSGALSARKEWAKRMTEVSLAKERAIEEERFPGASKLRDQERELREEAKSYHRARLEAADELRQRLGLSRAPSGDT